MKIAFFTEIPHNGVRIPRTHKNMRTEFAWMASLESHHFNIQKPDFTSRNEPGYPDIEEMYDLGIVIIPKKNPNFDVKELKKRCKVLASMQEGPFWYFQDYDLSQQVWYSNILQEMDFLFVHNKIDQQYFTGISGKKSFVLPSLMIEDGILAEELDQGGILRNNSRQNVMIGGNFCSWYGGFDSYIVAQEFGEPIYAPSMGRKIEGEDKIENLNHLPYLVWKDWILNLSKCKYGVHLMRTHAAGTFALNCAFLGIPCIGYTGLDTQMICHPETTVSVGDMIGARKIAQRLRDDSEFYNTCSENARKLYSENFSEEEWLKTFRSNMEKI